MFKSDGSRHDFPLRSDRIVIGRRHTCDLRVPVPSVSREHCELRIDPPRVVLRDLGSSNGTFHNHTRVERAELAAGDTITVGPVSFTVVIDGKPAEPLRALPDSTEPESEPAERSRGVEATSSGDADTVEAVELDDPVAALDRLARAELEQDTTTTWTFPDDEPDEAEDRTSPS